MTSWLDHPMRAASRLVTTAAKPDLRKCHPTSGATSHLWVLLPLPVDPLQAVVQREGPQIHLQAAACFLFYLLRSNCFGLLIQHRGIMFPTVLLGTP